MADSGFPNFPIDALEFIARNAGAARGRFGLQSARNEEETKLLRSAPSSNSESARIRPNRTKSNQTGATWIKAPGVRSNLGRTCLDLGRARWMRGGGERMDASARCLSDRNSCFNCYGGQRRSGIRGKSSLMFASGSGLPTGNGGRGATVSQSAVRFRPDGAGSVC